MLGTKNWGVVMTIKAYIAVVLFLLISVYSFFEYQNRTDEILIKESFIQKAKSKFYEKDDALNSYTNKLEKILLSLGSNQFFIDYISTSENKKYVKELFLSTMKTTPDIYRY